MKMRDERSHRRDETVGTEPRRCCGEGGTWCLGGLGGVQSRPSVTTRAGDFDGTACIVLLTQARAGQQGSRVAMVLGCVGELVDLLIEDTGGGW
jgi:hypothetical protein